MRTIPTTLNSTEIERDFTHYTRGPRTVSSCEKSSAMRVFTMVKHEQNVTDTTWLRLDNYHVMPLNLRLGKYISELDRALRRGVVAYPDLRRHGFYPLELESGQVYVHVRENAKTVYLVAHSSFAAPHASLALTGLENDHERSGYQNAGR